MRRPLALAFAAFIVSMGVFLVGSLLIVGSTTSKVSFPTSVVVMSPRPSPSPAPVSFPATMVGETSRATLGGRGGQAGTQTPTDGEAGQVSVRVKP